MIYRNSMKSVLAAALIATTLIGSASARESGPGNGGDGVLVNGRLYSLDLLEAGDSVAENPYFDPQVPSADDQEYAKILDRVTRALGHLPQSPVELVARKLHELSKLDPIFSLVTLQTIELYSWSLHEDRATEKVRVSAQDCSSQTESLIEKNLIGSSIRRGLD